MAFFKKDSLTKSHRVSFLPCGFPKEPITLCAPCSRWWIITAARPFPSANSPGAMTCPSGFSNRSCSQLKSQGWVDSEAGIRGGYVFAKNPAKITMGEVVRHFDGILAPIDCVSVTGYKRCSQESVCRFRRVFFDARNYVAGA
jgi:hypothetical protein